MPTIPTRLHNLAGKVMSAMLGGRDRPAPCIDCGTTQGRPQDSAGIDPADTTQIFVGDNLGDVVHDMLRTWPHQPEMAPAENAVNHVIEGVVTGHALCSYKEGCTEAPMRVVDPYTYDVDGVEVEIDICATHLRELSDDI